MPLIDIADLMERVSMLLASAPLEPDTPSPFQAGSKSESLLGQPMPELNAPPRRFEEVFSADGRMLKQLAHDARHKGCPIWRHC